MRKLIIGLLLVAACGGSTVTAETTPPTTAPPTTAAPTTTLPTTTPPTTPAPDTTIPDITDQLAEELGEATCDTFETAYLPDMVEVIQTNIDLSENEALALIATAIVGWCPDEIDQFIVEMDVFYDDATAAAVLAILEEAS